MKISQILTISIKHIRKNTRKFLQMDLDSDTCKWMQVAQNGDDGYYININKGVFESTIQYNKGSAIPEDLLAIIWFALDVNCQTILLSKSEKILQYLPYYEYDDNETDGIVNDDAESCCLGNRVLKTAAVREMNVGPATAMGVIHNAKRAKDFFGR